MSDEKKGLTPPPVPLQPEASPGDATMPSPLRRSRVVPPPIPAAAARPEPASPARFAARSRRLSSSRDDTTPVEDAQLEETHDIDIDLDPPTLERPAAAELILEQATPGPLPPRQARGGARGTVGDLELLADEGGVFTSLHAFYEEELESLPEGDHRRRAILLYELGDLEELVLRDPLGALSRFEAAFVADPSFPPAQKALRRHHAAAGRWEEYLLVLQEEVEATPDGDLRAALLTHQGEVLEFRLEKTDQAIDVLRSATKLAPRGRRAAELLRGIYARKERWSELQEVLRILVNVTAGPQERGRLMVEMAEVAEFRLERPAEAEELYGQALALDPVNEAAAVALRRLYLGRQRWKELSELLAREAGREHEPEERFADLFRAARIAGLRLHDDGRSASLLETATALRPGDLLPLQALVQIYQQTGRYDDLVAALGRMLRLVREPQDRASLCFRLGQVLEEWLDQPAEAIKAYQQALKEEPSHEASIRALAQLYQQFENWEELAELTLLQAERNRDEPRRADGYLRAAQICEGRLGDMQRAISLYDRAYRVQVGLPEAFRSLHRIYRASGQWEPLAELFETQAAATKDPYQVLSYLRSAAWINEEMLKSRERAIATLEQLHQRSPEDRETLVNLARLYEEVGRVEELRQTLESWAKVTEDPREAIELRRRVGELLEGPLRRPDQAVDIYQAILADAPDDRPTLERLKELYERAGRWRDLAQTLQSELEVCELAAERAPLLMQIGQLNRDKLGDSGQAVAAFELALQADLGYTPASLALQELLRSEGLWERLVELKIGEAERMRGISRAASVLYEAGEICEEQLQDRQQAEQLYTRALELDARHLPARQGLERIYLAALDRNALESHYLREAESSNNPILRLRAYLRLGALFDGSFQDPVGAAAAYESALQTIEDQPDALHALAALLRRTAGWERLAALLPRIAAQAQDRESAVAALNEWATIVHVHLADRWDPGPIFERILEGEPSDMRAMFVLESLAFERGQGDALVALSLKQVKAGLVGEWGISLCTRAAALLFSWGRQREAMEVLRAGLKSSSDYLPAVRMLRRFCEQQGEWAEAAELLLREGDLVSSRPVSHSLLIRAGRIYLERFGDEGRARSALQRVFDDDPENGAAFDNLVQILEAAEEWHTLVGLYKRRLAAVASEGHPELLFRLATLYRDSLGEITQAIQMLRELLELAPDSAEALQQIAELCEAQQRWRDAEGYLGRLATLATDPQARRQALLQRALILEEQLGEQEQAMEVLQRLLDEFPGDREALSRCVIYYQRQGNWQRTVELLEGLARSGPPAERLNHLVNLAEVFSRTMNEPERAERVLRRAALICVDTAAGIERLSEYYERRGDFEGLVVLLGAALEELPPEGSPGAVATRLARARVLAGRLLRPNEAEKEIRLALQVDPGSLASRLELAGLHLWGDNLAEAIAEYTRVLDLEPFSVDAFRGLSRVFERKGDLERAGGAAQAVCALAGKEVPERKLASQLAASMEVGLGAAAVNPLGQQDFWQLLAHPDEPKVAAELLYLLADYIPQIFPDEVERSLGGSIMPVSAEDTLAERCAGLARVLGVEGLECCIGQQLATVATALPGARPKLVVDDGFANRATAAEFRFAAGRALSGILTRSFYLSVLSPRSVELLLAAAVELFERGFGGYLAQGREVEDLSRSLSRAIPRRLRKTIEEPARAYAAGQPVAAAAWYVAAQRSGERAGLLLAGDVGAALKVLSEEQASRAARADLLRFAVGPHLYEARRRLGLSS